jgi:hypothetical protein
MKQLLSATSMVVAWAAVASTFVVVGQSAPPRVRTLFWYPDAPIPGRLLPDDEVVRVERGGILDYITPSYKLTVEEVIADVAVRADLVAVVDIDQVEGILSDADAWVSTRFTGTVRQVIRERKVGDFQVRQQLQAYLSGGEVLVGKVLVRIGDPQRWPVNQPYLLFLGRGGRQDGHLYALLSAVVIKNGKLNYPNTPPQPPPKFPPHPLRGLTVAAVTKMAREATTSWLCGKCETHAP